MTRRLHCAAAALVALLAVGAAAAGRSPGRLLQQGPPANSTKPAAGAAAPTNGTKPAAGQT